MPAEGFTAMFAARLSRPLIDIELGVDYRDAVGCVRFDSLGVTGTIDESFGFRYGRLPCGSLEFV